MQSRESCPRPDAITRGDHAGGLDALVDFTHDRIAAQRLEVFHLASGQARLVDDDADGYGDRIVDGTWQAELNLGLGLRKAPATFEGAR